MKNKKKIYVVYSRYIGNIKYISIAYKTLEKANTSLLLQKNANPHNTYGIAEWELR